jgi:hypothetical protein
MNAKISYWVDNQNIICKVDDAWDTNLDADNWTERASSRGVIGKNLLEFICDDITRMYVATMIESVRISSKTLTRPYRCDSPHKKRFMQMTISPAEAENGQLCVSHELLREEPLKRPVMFENATEWISEKASHQIREGRAGLAAYLIRCSICNRLRDKKTDLWHETDSLPHWVVNIAKPIKIVYGVCTNCMDELKASHQQC